jgi:phosphoglycerate dehydrogenase-like enzyme
MRLLVTGAFPIRDNERQLLASLGQGWSVVDQMDESAPLLVDPRTIDAIVCNRLFDHHDLNAFTQLKGIQLLSAGMDQVNLEVIQSRSIQLFNAKDIYSIPIAEWTVGKILEIAKSSRMFYEQQTQNRWQKRRDLLEINGLTALILGFGDIGKAVAQRLRPFGVNVIGVGRRVVNVDDCDQFVLIEAVDHWLPQCDIVVICLPLNNQTEHFLNRERLQKCKPGSILVNISRGKIIEETALAELAASGHFRGIALDVFEQEPLPATSPLWAEPKALVTPHNSFVSSRNRERLFQLICKNLLRLNPS